MPLQLSFQPASRTHSSGVRGLVMLAFQPRGFVFEPVRVRYIFY